MTDQRSLAATKALHHHYYS